VALVKFQMSWHAQMCYVNGKIQKVTSFTQSTVDSYAHRLSIKLSHVADMVVHRQIGRTS